MARPTPRFLSLVCFFGALVAIGCGECRTEGCDCSSNSDCDSGTCLLEGDDATCFDGELNPTGGTGGSGATGGTSGSGGSAGTGGTGCQTLETDPRQTFDACGGELLGMWRLTNMDATGMFMTLASATDTRECDTALAAQTESFDFLMSFAEGGEFDTYVGAFQISLLTDNACFREGVGVSCDNVVVAGQCQSDSCDVCKCDIGNPAPASGVGTWSSMEGTIFVDGSEGYDYCVTENTLSLLNQSGVRFTLERVHDAGQPAPCVERTSATCLRGTGCARSGTGCLGTAPAACRFEDYFVTPGCEVAAGP